MNTPSKRGPLQTIRKILKYILDVEKNSPEGRTNTSVLVLATLAAIVTPFFSGTMVEIQNGVTGWRFSLALGDGFGSVLALLIGGLVCVVIVAGTNYFRRPNQFKSAKPRE